MVRASPAGATHFNIGEDPHRAADAKMTVFVRASVYVWGLLQRCDTFFYFFFPFLN
jgi:hypothetical protein